MADEPDIEGLVLLHEDVTIESAAFIAAIRTELADPDVAVVGAIGALRPASLRWWQGEGRGRVRDSTGLVDFGGGRHDVDVLDGLCLVLSPWAIQHLRFDESAFDGFHGYDSDICLQARAAGKRVRVTRPADHAPHARRLRRRGRLRPRQRRLRREVARPAVRPPRRPRARARHLRRLRRHRARPCPPPDRLEVAACGRCGSGLTLPATADAGAPEQAVLAAAAATARADWIEARRTASRRPVRRRRRAGGRARPSRHRDRRPPAPTRRSSSAPSSARRTPPTSPPRARAALAPGGLLLAECRNFAATEAAVDPIVWGRPDLADLRTLLTPAGARALLERTSFTAVETSVGTSEAYDPPELWRARRDHWASMRLGADSENVLLVRGRAA